MTTASIETREHDHKAWLNDIERWRYDIKVWDGGGENMMSDAKAVVAAVEAFLQTARDHRDRLNDLEKRIAACEGDQFEHKRSEEALAAAHAEMKVAVTSQHDLHKRLEKKRHDLMATLSAAADK